MNWKLCISPLMARLRLCELPLALVLTLVLSGVAKQAKAADCTCANLAEMKYRIKEGKALIQGFQAEIARIGRNVTFSNAAYNAFETGSQQPMLNALKRANRPAPTTAGARTDPASCQPYVPTHVSACLQKALDVHEGHHALACQQRKGNFAALHPFTDYRDDHPLVEAYEEEIVAYTDEINYLQEQINALPPACKPPGWILTWEVQVRGEGASTGKSPFKWKVDRMYSGTVELFFKLPLKKNLAPFANPAALQQMMAMTPQQLMAMKAQMQQNASWTVKALSVPMTVSINDEIISFSRDQGEGDSFEETTRTQQWKGSGPDTMNGQSSVSFEEDAASGTYNINIDVQPNSLATGLTYQKTEDIRRSPFGYGNAPTQQRIVDPPAQRKFGDLKLPELDGLLSAAKVHHVTDLPLVLNGGMLQFNSDWQTVKPLTAPFKTWPQAGQNLKVRVYYVLKKPE